MLVIGNGRLVTRDAGNPFIENGAVAMDGNVIKKVGTLEEVKKEFPEAEFVDAKGGVIMPAWMYGSGIQDGLLKKPDPCEGFPGLLLKVRPPPGGLSHDRC